MKPRSAKYFRGKEEALFKLQDINEWQDNEGNRHRESLSRNGRGDLQIEYGISFDLFLVPDTGHSGDILKYTPED
jgi:hypothetical protein